MGDGGCGEGKMMDEAQGGSAKAFPSRSEARGRSSATKVQGSQVH